MGKNGGGHFKQRQIGERKRFGYSKLNMGSEGKGRGYKTTKRKGEKGRLDHDKLIFIRVETTFPRTLRKSR